MALNFTSLLSAIEQSCNLPARVCILLLEQANLLPACEMESVQLRSLTQNSEESRVDTPGDENHAIVNQLREFKRMVIQSQVSESQVQLQAGCTAIVALKRRNALHVANAGDSRGVLCRAGAAYTHTACRSTNLSAHTHIPALKT